MQTPWAPVECVGVPILLSQGVLGGHDNGRALVDLWIGPDCSAIGTASLGYIGSSMPGRATPAEQADVYAALLDNIDCGANGDDDFSEGGPSVIQFALRHPDRL